MNPLEMIAEGVMLLAKIEPRSKPHLSPAESRDYVQMFLQAVAQIEEENNPWETALQDLNDSILAQFLLEGVRQLRGEWPKALSENQALAAAAETLANRLAAGENPASLHEQFWAVFFPEAAGITGHETQRIAELRQKRTVKISRLSLSPLQNPAEEILFTANVLLTLPEQDFRLEKLQLETPLIEKLRRVRREPQRYWYDHPIQIGVAPENNEFIYGLRGLNQMMAYEKERGQVAPDVRLTCLLSVSVTHDGLHEIARPYLEAVMRQADPLPHLEVYLFTETDTLRLIDEILLPAAEKVVVREEARSLLTAVFGVDGSYGRHYSFLKAIAPLWRILADEKIRATFKIDLDQVFPQEELVAQTGRSALEHFKTPLWGATAVDSDGRSVELGLIAGALVNESDINQGLFTPDVRFPSSELTADQLIFHSPMPQALSTQAEMMTRYDQPPLDGRAHAIQRVHVTGGTNGILIETLTRFRLFTPTFFGRAEDQAYLLIRLIGEGVRPGYIHQPGLIMRHDKEAFAQEAIKAAAVGKLIGDFVRILYFSAYARILGQGDVTAIKAAVDPFTGGFISRIPITVTLLRFCLKAHEQLGQDNPAIGEAFLKEGAVRLAAALKFVQGDPSPMRQQFEQEKEGWDLYFDILEEIAENPDEYRPQFTKLIAACRFT
ncbi:MAG: hypothetical protein QNJ45_08085 [Ardenticatenaceae bacterium]|nr:hypothetical protein [Ardenticatenaceae bacterium]